MLYSVAGTVTEVGMPIQYKGNEETGPSTVLRNHMFSAGDCYNRSNWKQHCQQLNCTMHKSKLTAAASHW